MGAPLPKLPANPLGPAPKPPLPPINIGSRRRSGGGGGGGNRSTRSPLGRAPAPWGSPRAVPPQQRRAQQQPPVRVVVNQPAPTQPKPAPIPAASPRNKPGSKANDDRETAARFYGPDLGRFVLGLPAKHQEMFHAAARHGARGAREAYQRGGYTELQHFREQQRQEVRDRAELLRRRQQEAKAERERKQRQKQLERDKQANPADVLRNNTKPVTDEERDEIVRRARERREQDPILQQAREELEGK